MTVEKPDFDAKSKKDDYLVVDYIKAVLENAGANNVLAKAIFNNNIMIFESSYDLEQTKTAISESAIAERYADELKIIPDGKVESTAAPNDPDFAKTWALTHTRATRAWDFHDESKAPIIVAVIDSGVDYDHPDLKDHMWVNEAEVGGSTSEDLDGNGVKHDVYGYDFGKDVFGNATTAFAPKPHDGCDFSKCGHGTHVAGTIAAVPNNEIGTAGIAGTAARIMALKVTDFCSPNDCSFWISSIISAMEYACKNGAKIVNHSWGINQPIGNEWVDLLYTAFKDAKELCPNQLHVAAAGNDGMDNDVFDQFPANFARTEFGLNNVLTIVNSNHNNQISTVANSQWGKHSTHMAAPGQWIYSTMPEGKYMTMSGTSMATPAVAGCAALVWSQHTELDYLGVKDALIRGGTPEESLKDITMFGRVLNCYNSMKLIQEGCDQQLGDIVPVSRRMDDVEMDIPEDASIETIADRLTRLSDQISRRLDAEGETSCGGCKHRVEEISNYEDNTCDAFCDAKGMDCELGFLPVERATCENAKPIVSLSRRRVELEEGPWYDGRTTNTIEYNACNEQVDTDNLMCECESPFNPKVRCTGCTGPGEGLEGKSVDKSGLGWSFSECRDYCDSLRHEDDWKPPSGFDNNFYVTYAGGDDDICLCSRTCAISHDTDECKRNIYHLGKHGGDYNQAGVINAPSFKKFESAYCQPSDSWEATEEQTAMEAQKSCQANPECGGVYLSGCVNEPGRIFFCKAGANVIDNTDTESCVYRQVAQFELKKGLGCLGSDFLKKDNGLPHKFLNYADASLECESNGGCGSVISWYAETTTHKTFYLCKPGTLYTDSTSRHHVYTKQAVDCDEESWTDVLPAIGNSPFVPKAGVCGTCKVIVKDFQNTYGTCNQYCAAQQGGLNCKMAYTLENEQTCQWKDDSVESNSSNTPTIGEEYTDSWLDRVKTCAHSYEGNQKPVCECKAKIPTMEPTNAPTDSPTESPTNSPTNAPTFSPTESPTDAECVPGFAEMPFSNSATTCALGDQKIKRKRVNSLAQCKELCLEKAECTHFALNPDNACVIFKSCEETRETPRSWLTYKLTACGEDTEQTPEELCTGLQRRFCREVEGCRWRRVSPGQPKQCIPQ